MGSRLVLKVCPPAEASGNVSLCTKGFDRNEVTNGEDRLAEAFCNFHLALEPAPHTYVET